MSTLEVVWTGDARNHVNWPPTDLQGFLGWCAMQGIDPKYVHRIEIREGDGKYIARLHEDAVNGDGRRYPTADGGIAQREPYDVPVACLPPGVEVK